jgi:hypothetical protein
VGLVKHEQQQREDADGARQHAPEQECASDQGRGPPHERVQVVAEWGPAEQRVVDLQQQVGQRSEDLASDTLVDPPRVAPLTRDTSRLDLVVDEVGKETPTGVVIGKVTFDRSQIVEVVEQKANPERRQKQQQPHDEDNDLHQVLRCEIWSLMEHRRHRTINRGTPRARAGTCQPPPSARPE